MQNRVYKILAIDDNQDNLISIRALINDAFPEINVITSLTGEKGIELAFIEDPDVILLDVVMPIMDGYEVCKRLKSNNLLNEIPVVFVTALKDDKDSRIKALEVGADAFLSKPIDVSELTAQIRAMIKIKSISIEKRDEKEQLANLVYKRTEELEDELQKRIKIEAELREKEVQYRNLANSGVALIWTSGTNKLCNYFNEPWLNFTGRKLEQELGNGWTEGIHEEDFDRCMNVYLSSFGQRISFDMEYRLRHCSGEYRWIRDLGTPNFNRSGEFVGYIGHCFDITDQKKIEHQLKVSELKFRNVFEHSLVGISMTSIDGKLQTNEAFSKITGYSKEELQTKTWQEITHPDDIEATEEIVRQILDGKVSSARWEKRYIHKKGNIVWVDISTSLQRDENGNPLYYISSIVDITDRKNTAKELIESEELFSLYLKHSPIYAFIKEVNQTESRVLKASDNFIDMIGVSAENMIGKTMDELFPPDLAQKINVDDWNVVSNGTLIKIDEELNGRFYTTLKYPIIQRGKHLLAGYTIDITERILAEQQTKKHYYEQLLLSELAQKLASIETIDEIYECIGNLIYELCPNSYILISNYNDELKTVNISNAFGLNDHIAEIQELLNFNLFSFHLKIDEMSIDELNSYSSRSFLKLSEGLYELSGRKISKAIGSKLEKILNVKSIYVKGFTWNNKLFGGVIVLMKPAEVVDNLGLLEIIINQASVAIQRRIGQEQLRQSEEKFRSIFENMVTGCCFDKLIYENGKAIDYKILDVSPSFEKIVGIPRDKAVGNLATEVYGTTNIPYFETYIRVAETGIPESFEIYHAPTEKFIHITTICPEKGKFSNILLDITERKRAEIELINSELKFRSTFDQSPVGSVIVGLDTRFIKCNAAFCSFLGYTADELVGKSISEITFSEDIAKGMDGLKQIIDGKIETFTLQKRYLRKNGKIVWGEVSICLIRDEKNKPLYFLPIIQDITERKRSEKELIKAKERAEESDRLKSAFLANMSHEIRTPMNGILGFVELLKEPSLKGDDQNKYIEIIEKSGMRMLNIINDIVDISKIESGQMELFLSKTNINEQIEYIYTFFKPEAEAKGLQLSYKSHLTSEESVIITDREKLYAILINLGKNAIKYTKEGSVEITCSRNGNILTFAVKDTGFGIPKNRQKAIFDRFVQADLANQHALQGAGLGLAITKAFIKMLRGNIWLDSKVGRGSTFYFTIPYNKE